MKMKYCPDCGFEKPVSEFGKSRSTKDGLQAYCKVHRYERVLGSRHKNIENGKCRYCGKEADGSKGLCKKHSKMNTNSTIKYYSENISNGCCRHCGKPLMENSSSLCEVHWFKQKSIKSFGTEQHWEYLRDLFEKQNGLCYYTGVELVAGVNASVDHKKPRSTHPELISEPSNVVWCSTSVNSSKKELTDEEYFKKIKSDCHHGN